MDFDVISGKRKRGRPRKKTTARKRAQGALVKLSGSKPKRRRIGGLPKAGVNIQDLLVVSAGSIGFTVLRDQLQKAVDKDRETPVDLKYLSAAIGAGAYFGQGLNAVKKNKMLKNALHGVLIGAITDLGKDLLTRSKTSGTMNVFRTAHAMPNFSRMSPALLPSRSNYLT